MRSTTPSITSRRRFGSAAVASMLFAAVAACGGGSSASVSSTSVTATVSGTPEDETTLAPAATDPGNGQSVQEFCKTLQGLLDQPADWTPAVPLSGLLATIGDLSSLKNALQALESAAPLEIRPVVGALVSPLGSPTAQATKSTLGAFATTVATDPNWINGIDQLDSYSLTSCGVAAFGAESLAVIQNPYPRREGDVVIVPPDNYFGRVLCSHSLGGTPYNEHADVVDGVMVQECDGRVFGVRLDDLALTIDLLLPKSETVDKSYSRGGGGVFAVLTSEIVPQSGLTPERTIQRIHAYDVQAGTELWSKELTPTEDASSNYILESVSSEGTVFLSGYFAYSGPGEGADRPGLAIARDGNIAWSASTYYGTGASDGNVVIVKSYDSASSKSVRIVDIDTGETLHDFEESGSTAKFPVNPAYNATGIIPYTYCQTYVDLGDNSFFNYATGEVVTGGRGFGTASRVLSDFDGGLSGLRPDGGIAWHLDDSVLDKWYVVGGQIVVEDGTGRLILVDLDNGTEADTLSHLPYALFDRGRWESVEVSVPGRDSNYAFGWRQAENVFQCADVTPKAG